MKQAAQFFSFITHPVWMPLVAFLCIFAIPSGISYMTVQTKLIVLLIPLTFTIVVPLLFVAALRMSGWLPNFSFEKKKERMVILLFATLSLYISYQLLKSTPIHPIFKQTLLVGTTLTWILALISRVWKISLHMASIGALSGLFFILSVKFQLPSKNLFVLALLCSGLLGSARIFLHKHTPLQVYIGFLVGFCAMLLLLFKP